MATEAEKLAELERLKLLRTSVFEAITAVAAGAQSYTLDTGQTRRTVTKANVTELQKLYAWLSDLIAKLEGELGLGTGVGKQIYVIPGF